MHGWKTIGFCSLCKEKNRKLAQKKTKQNMCQSASIVKLYNQRLRTNTKLLVCQKDDCESSFYKENINVLEGLQYRKEMPEQTLKSFTSAFSRY